jgi:hypothetical protein
MPLHDWTLVDASTFHHFHVGWLWQLSEHLNEGGLPPEFYALTESYYGEHEADVLTPQASSWDPVRNPSVAVAVAERPFRRMVHARSKQPVPRRKKQRRILIRRTSNHGVVAWIELISPSNKDRKANVAQFAKKITAALNIGLHGLLLDVLPPGPADPQGMHAAVWKRCARDEYSLPKNRPQCMTSYVADEVVEAYIKPLAVGDEIPTMPLFVDVGWYVNVPLETTYMQAYAGMPRFWQDVLEGRAVSSS